MRTIFRFLLLCVFSAAGVAMAIALASRSSPEFSGPDDPSENRQEAKAQIAQSPADSSRAIAAPIAAAPAPPQPIIVQLPPAASERSESSASQAMMAQYQPLVAAQVDGLKAATDQLKEVTLALRQTGKKPASPEPSVPSPSAVAEPAAPAASAPALAPADPLPAAAPRGRALRGPLPDIVAGEGDRNLSINLRDDDVRTVLEMLSKQMGMNILTSKSVQGRVSATLTNVDAETALDAICRSANLVARRDGSFIYVGSVADLAEMDQNRDQLGQRVYRPNFVKAADLQALITPLLTKNTGTISVTTPAEVDIPTDNVKTGGNNLAGQDVVVVRDLEMVLKRVDDLVREVDQKPLQVAIEAMVLSVKLNDSTKTGVDLALLRDQNNARLVSGSPLTNLANIDVTSGGLKFGFLDSSLGVFLSALETVGDTNVIAAPRLMCLNKQRAEILIGSQLGYVSTTVTENAATQTVAFLEVGTQLRFRPFIARDGTIRLEVHPELSTGSVKVEGGFTLPTKEVTQVTTNIMCRDGCTVVIGGLIREDLADNRTQIPLLGSLPILGGAFRRKQESNDRNEVIVLITPHIVNDDYACQEGAQAGCESMKRRNELLDNMSPLARRYQARRQLSLARCAWEQNNSKAAAQHVRLAMHYDPVNLDVVRMRDELAAAGVLCATDCELPWPHATGSPPGMFHEQEGETAVGPAPIVTPDSAAYKKAAAASAAVHPTTATGKKSEHQR